MKEVFMPEPVDVSVRPDGALDFGNGIVGPTKADRDYVEQKFSNEETAVINELNSNGIVVTRSDSFLGKFLTSVKEKTTDTLKAVNQRLGGKPVRIGVPAVLAFAALTEACSGERATGQTGTEVDLVTVTPTPVATETMIPTPTPEVTVQPTPIATPTPEVKQEAPCVVVPQEFCSQAELLENTDNRGTWLMIAFNLPKDTPLYSPIKGIARKAQFPSDNAFKGFAATISDPDNPEKGTVSFAGDIEFDNMNTANVNPGDLFAKVGDAGATNFGYSIMISAKKDSVGEKLLREMFPEAFEEPAKRVELNSNSKSLMGSPVYSDNPPPR